MVQTLQLTIVASKSRLDELPQLARGISRKEVPN
jgi:hypothetical protein